MVNVYKSVSVVILYFNDIHINESVKSIKGFIEKINAKLKIKVNMYGKEYDVFKYLHT